MLSGIGIRIVVSGSGDATLLGVGDLELSGIDRMIVLTSGTGDLTSFIVGRSTASGTVDLGDPTIVTSPMLSERLGLTLSTIDNGMLLSGVMSMLVVRSKVFSKKVKEE